MSNLSLQFSIACGRKGVPRSTSFQAWAQAAWLGASAKGYARECGVSLRLVDLAEGRALNLQYRGRDYATNVLSFAGAGPGEIPPGAPKNYRPDWLGDLLICVPVVQSEAIAQGKAVKAHYAHLTVHGVLHLLGFDHIKKAEAKVMEALEVQILAGLGFADPY
jgi:probable rRNA maturation factor